MKKKLWDPLGMASAMMFHAQEGDPRLEKIVELHFQGPKLKTEDTYEPYTGTPELTPGEWKWASEISDATWADVSEQGLSTSMAPFTAEVTKDGVYPGVSGYGEGSMMTLADYGKFLSMIANHGMVGNTRILGPIAWKWLMTSTVTTSQGIGVLHSNYDASGSSGLFSVEMDWRFGYARPRGNVSSSDVSGAPIGGKPSVGPVLAASAFSGQWAGYYGTTYAFDEASGLYRVGGENTWLAGQPQLGNAFIADNNERFLGMITTPAHRDVNFAARPLPTAAPVAGGTDAPVVSKAAAEEALARLKAEIAAMEASLAASGGDEIDEAKLAALSAKLAAMEAALAAPGDTNAGGGGGETMTPEMTADVLAKLAALEAQLAAVEGRQGQNTSSGSNGSSGSSSVDNNGRGRLRWCCAAARLE